MTSSLKSSSTTIRTVAVNGKLTTVLGQSGAGPISGWNAPNRVVVARNVKPGQTFEISVLGGVNGPIALAPENYIWVRSATLDFFKPGALQRVAKRSRRKDRTVVACAR